MTDPAQKKHAAPPYQMKMSEAREEHGLDEIPCQGPKIPDAG